MNIIDLATKTMQATIKGVVDAIKTVVDAIKTTTDTTKVKVDTLDTRTSTMNTTLNTVNGNVASTKTTVDTIASDVVTVDGIADDILSYVGLPATASNSATTANAHAKMNFITDAVGAKTTAASNATSANLHAKINYLNGSSVGTPTSTASNATSGNAHSKLNYLLSKADEGIIGTLHTIGGSITFSTNTAGAQVRMVTSPPSSSTLLHTLTGKGFIMMVGHVKANGTAYVRIDDAFTLELLGSTSGVSSGFTRIPFKNNIKIYSPDTNPIPLSNIGVVLEIN